MLLWYDEPGRSIRIGNDTTSEDYWYSDGLGQNRRGVDMGPSVLRLAGLQARLERLGLSVVDHGNVPVPIAEEAAVEGTERRIKAVAEVCQAVYEFGRKCAAHRDFALFLGGDHSISIGTVAAAAQDERSVSSGSMPTPTSTRRNHPRAAIFTACPWLL